MVQRKRQRITRAIQAVTHKRQPQRGHMRPDLMPCATGNLTSYKQAGRGPKGRQRRQHNGMGPANGWCLLGKHPACPAPGCVQRGRAAIPLADAPLPFNNGQITLAHLAPRLALPPQTAPLVGQRGHNQPRGARIKTVQQAGSPLCPVSREQPGQPVFKSRTPAPGKVYCWQTGRFVQGSQAGATGNQTWFAGWCARPFVERGRRRGVHLFCRNLKPLSCPQAQPRGSDTAVHPHMPFLAQTPPCAQTPGNIKNQRPVKALAFGFRWYRNLNAFWHTRKSPQALAFSLDVVKPTRHGGNTKEKDHKAHSCSCTGLFRSRLVASDHRQRVVETSMPEISLEGKRPYVRQSLP